MTALRILTFLFLPAFLFLAYCDGGDVRGKIVIEYAAGWNAEIIEGYTKSSYSGTGTGTFEFINPDRLEVTVVKLDNSPDKMTVYIYEDERIVAGASTREPAGSAAAGYEFPY